MRGQRADDGHLRRVALRRGDGDLRPRSGVDEVVRELGEAAANNVHDGEEPRAPGLALSRRGEGVGRLAGLGERDDQGLRPDKRV